MSNAFITRRAGGVNLNFRITRYPIGTDLSNIIGKLNEIAILSDVELADWTISFDEPILPVTGSLWLMTAKTAHATFNMLKKNNATIGIGAVYQYYSGEWNSVDAKIYQNGTWNDFRTYLFREGMGKIIEWRGNNATFTEDSVAVIGSGSIPAIATYDMYDFSRYRKLFLELTPNLSTSNGYRFNIVFSKRNTGSWSDYYSSTQGYTPVDAIQCEKYLPNVAPIINGVRSTLEVDIADAVKEEPCYVAFAHEYVRSATEAAFTVHNVWLE